ncbi:MAG: glycosyltransferase [Clostridia bacterium]|nr:glycosyltransferase [Clostridia bacterium]
MEKLRLLIFIGSLSVGGGQMVAAQIVKNIDKTGIEISVLCYEGQTYSELEKEVEKNCSVEFLHERGKITPGKMLRIFAEISKRKPDIVHVHLGGMAYAVPWALLHNIPLLITAHTRPDQAFPAAVLPLIKWGLKKKKIRIAAVSEENLILMQQYFCIHDKRIVCINNGVEIEKFYQKKHNHFTFINVSRQDDNKNQAAIIYAFSKIKQVHPDAKLILAGDGPTHQQLIRLVKELNMESSVDLPGMVSDPEQYYAVSDVYIQSSHREAMPMSVLEALASGLPIISTDVGGLKDVIHGNGFIIPDHDDDALSEAMIRMISADDEQIQLMRSKSKEIVRKYSAPEMANQYLKYYLDMKAKK